MGAYQRGQTVVLTETFLNAAGATANPTTVTCKVQKSDGTETTYTTSSTPAIANLSTGVFQLILPATLSGQWAYRWEGTTGTTVAVDEREFSVLLSEFA